MFAPSTIEQPKPGFPLIPLVIGAGLLCLAVLFVQQQLAPPAPPQGLDRQCFDPTAEPDKAQLLARAGYTREAPSDDPAMARLTCYVKYDRPAAPPSQTLDEDVKLGQ